MEQVLPEIREGERIAGDGEIGIVDVRAKPSESTPPLHFHERHAECFLVLDGELTFRLEDRELQAGSETWVLLPPGVLHTFGVSGASTAHFLNIHVPSCGFGDFVRGLHASAGRREPSFSFRLASSTASTTTAPRMRAASTSTCRRAGSPTTCAGAIPSSTSTTLRLTAAPTRRPRSSYVSPSRVTT